MNSKIIVYGLGKMWKAYMHYVDREAVIAYADQAPKCDSIDGIQVIYPSQITQLVYDYVVVFSKFSTEAIKKKLVEEYSVPQDKIIDYFFYLFVLDKKIKVVNFELCNYLPQFFVDYNVNRVLDVDCGIYRLGIYNKLSIEFSLNDMRTVQNQAISFFTYLRKEQYRSIMNNLYENKYEKISELEKYDVIFLIDLFLYFDLEEVISIINKTYYKSKYILLTLPYCYSSEYEEWETYNYAEWGKVVPLQFGRSNAILIEKKREVRSEEIQIYVVTHKRYQPIEDSTRITIHAGMVNAVSLGYVGDDTGDNISWLNSMINECTAMYWIWKNTSHKYIGIEHYRRNFVKGMYVYDDSHLLGDDDIAHYMKRYDVIVAKHNVTMYFTVKECLRRSIDGDAFIKVYNRTEKAIMKCQPQYIECFNEVFAGYTFYPCNLMVMPKNIFDSYCEWLFSILFEVMKDLDLSSYDSYSQRVVGFMAERLLTVWLLNQNFRILELFYRLKDN